MIIESLLLAAVATAAQPVLPGFGNRYHGVQNYAGHRAEVNGRIWMPESCGGSSETPGAAYYGTHDHGEIVYARIGQLTIGISPWQELNDETMPLHEAARQNWLRDHGYTGGVRTFMNDAVEVCEERCATADVSTEGPTPIWKQEIQPRMILPLPEDMPRLRSRMQVDAAGAREALDRMGRPAQRVPIVLPMTTVASR